MDNLIKKSIKLARIGKFNDALKTLEKAEKKPILHPKIYVLKAIFIELSNEKMKYSFDDIEKFLKKAISIDDEYANALLEIGNYYYVENDNKLAQSFLKKAIEIYRKNLIDALITYAKSIEEAKTPQHAVKFLERFQKEFQKNEEIRLLIKEFEN